MALAIEISNVSKSFRRYRPDRPHTFQEVLARGLRGLRASDRFWALREVSFGVPKGRAVGIIGTNGSGKSTLLRLAGGIGATDSGRITVRGRVGALLDLGSGFHGDLTGRENVMVAGVLNGLTRREVQRRFDAIVDFSEIASFIDNPVRTYRSGMRMRLAFATNVHTNPDVMLIDEVLAVGDAAFQAKCIARIAQFKTDGCSILLVSHGLAVMQALCDEVVWLHHGRVMAHDAVNQVVRQYEAHIGYSMEPETASPVVVAHGPPAPPASGDPADGVATDQPRIDGVALFDTAGHALNTLRPGDGLRADIGLNLGTRSTSPHLRLRIVRDDGVVCGVFNTVLERRPPGTAMVSLHIERLDLAAGVYGVDVIATNGTSGATDAEAAGCPLLVEGEVSLGHDGVLAVPHRWRDAS